MADQLHPLQNEMARLNLSNLYRNHQPRTLHEGASIKTLRQQCTLVNGFAIGQDIPNVVKQLGTGLSPVAAANPVAFLGIHSHQQLCQLLGHPRYPH